MPPLQASTPRLHHAFPPRPPPSPPPSRAARKLTRQPATQSQRKDLPTLTPSSDFPRTHLLTPERIAADPEAAFSVLPLPLITGNGEAA